MGTSDLLDTATRRTEVLRLRKAGLTYRQIAQLITERFGEESLPGAWGPRYAHKDVARELSKLREELGDLAKDICQIEVERLNDITRALWPLVARDNPDLGAVDRMLRVMERRAKLLGIDAPSRFDLRGVDLSQLTEEQLEALARGEDLIDVLTATGTS